MQDEDLFAPMDNGAFLAQMVPFSTASGLDPVNQTLGMIPGQIGGSRIATGASPLSLQATRALTVLRTRGQATATEHADTPIRLPAGPGGQGSHASVPPAPSDAKDDSTTPFPRRST